MESLAASFKDRSLKVIDVCVEKLQEYKGTLPFNIGLIQMGKTMFLDSIEGDCIISIFIDDSVDSWDAIKERNEELLIETFKSEVSDRAPMMQSLFSNIIDFLLKKRSDIFEKEFEDYLWNEVDELIKISIKFAHLKREWKKKSDGKEGYTVRYKPGFSVKKHAENWGVDITQV